MGRKSSNNVIIVLIIFIIIVVIIVTAYLLIQSNSSAATSTPTPSKPTQAPSQNPLPVYKNIKQKQSAQCLDWGGNGTPYFNPCDGGNPWMKWKFEPYDDTWYLLKHSETGKCLDGDASKDNGQQLYGNECQPGNQHQLWKFDQTQSDGNSVLVQWQSNKCLDGSHEGKEDGKEVYFNDCNSGNTHQLWKPI